MELGMIGLGRMGTNMVRRLLRAGHQCVVYDLHPEAVQALVKEGAIGTTSLEDFAHKLKKPRAVWMMVPAAVVDPTLTTLVPLLERDDVVIDGGNSYYHDDIRRAAELKPKGIHYVDVGTSGGVWGAERGYCLMIGGEETVVRRLDPIFAALAPGIEAAPRTPGREKVERHGRTRLSALRAERRGPLRQDGPQRHRVRHHGRLRGGAEHPPPRQRRQTAAHCRCRDHAAAPPRALLVRPESGRHRRGLAPRQRDRLVAPGPGRHARCSRARTWRSSPAGCRTRARGAGRSWRPSTSRSRPPCSAPRCTNASARAARPTSPTRCCPPCVTSSAATQEKAAAAEGRRLMTASRSDALVLFGVTGDLAHKMIFPALYAMAKRGALKVPVIGVAFPNWSLAQSAQSREGQHQAIGRDR